MTIVGDASVALLWCFQLNKSDRAEELLRSDHHLIAPDLVIAEITNAAWKFVFLPCSYGFRPGRAAHQALQALRAAIMSQ